MITINYYYFDLKRTPGAYHLGFTSDLDLLITIIHQRHPKLKIYISGFSLGNSNYNIIIVYSIKLL